MTNLLWGVRTKNDGMFSADEYFVFNTHAEAMEVFRELRISGDVHAYGSGQHQNLVGGVGGLRKHGITWLDGDHHPFLQSNKTKKHCYIKGGVVRV
jgi:hypothetical protein